MNTELIDRINMLEKDLIAKQTLFKQYNGSLCEKKAELNKLILNSDVNVKSSELLVKFSSDMRQVVGDEIERLVTAVLQKTFSDRYSFKIEFEPRRGVIEADFFLYNNKQDKKIDIIESAGGTVADEVSAVLFFVISEMVKPGEGWIAFDEIGKHISPDKREAFFTFLKKLIQMYNKQVIYVSHQTELMDIADRVIELSLDEEEHVVCNVRN
jgi:DNA repair ATPase RecN